MNRVDEVALVMANAVRAKRGDTPIEHIEKLAKEAVPFWRIKASAAITYLASVGASA